MESVETLKEQSIGRPGNSGSDYYESLTKLVQTAVKNALDQEMQRATQELIEEQKKAIRQIVDEYKAALRQVVEQEKKNIWTRAEELRESILKLGL